MFKDFFLFELKLRLKSASTYIFFLLAALLPFFSIAARDFGPLGGGKVLLNGPYAVLLITTQVLMFGSILLAAIFGPAILRDFHGDTYQLIFTKPISKFGYLGGRWAGSLVTAIFIFSGIIFGIALGTLMPWADKLRLAPNDFGMYFHIYASIGIVQIFFLGSLFFCVAALTRNIVVVYLQGVGLFAFYLIELVMVVTSNKLDRTWASIADPFGLILVQSLTRYWTVVERNALIPHWTGVFVYNRLMWLGVGALALLVAFALFPMSAEVLGSRRSSRKAEEARADDENIKREPRRNAVQLPRVTQIFGGLTTWKQLLSMTRMRFFNIVRELPFWAITLIMLVFVVVSGHFAGNNNGVEVWPVTYLMVSVVSGQSGLFLFIIGALYAGEVMWRERDVRFEQIHDSLPLRDWTDFVSKLLALALVETLLASVVLGCGVLSQALDGYFRFELGHYAKEIYLIYLPQLLMVILLALFLQTVLSNKFVAHAVVVGFFLLIPILYAWGIENRMYLYGEVTPHTYSDMNGYGHFVKALFWVTSYWLCIGGLLGVIAIAFGRRGTEQSFKSRWKKAGLRMRALIPAAAVFLLLAGASGAVFFYNTHVLNRFLTAQQSRHRTAEYEKLYKKYERLPQPKVTAVDVTVDIFPERRSFEATGSYLLLNHSDKPIDEVHITDSKDSLEEVKFDRGFKQILDDKEHFYSIYKLEKPLEPKETMKMNFRVGYTSRGFKDGGERPEFAYNGTFFDRDYFPFIGYNQGNELDDPVRRREEKLPQLEEMAPPGDPYYSNINLFMSDSEWVTFHAVVSTSADQIAIAPGYLKREWTENERRYFEYSMGDTRINNFFSFVSGRYSIKRDQWKNVKLEIYYQPGDEFNLDKMMDATKSGLDYYETNFGPYQFNQFRVLEFPRYRGFAQSFPNTVPYSEDLGFIERLKKPDDIDFVYFVTAHELAHQWWGHQLLGSQTQGSNMMAESLAEYSALKVMQKKYGEDMTRKLLRYELDGYLRGRAGETRHEPPLVLVQREPYVWYQKGSLVMFALADYIGDDKVNLALHNFLEKNRYATGPFPDTRGFVAALREQTPPELQYVITDMFESIVLYENKAVSATYVETPEKKYEVTLKTSSQKKTADGSGNETPMTIHDLIDVGVFSGTKEHLKRLNLHKEWITQQNETFTFVVDEKPAFAGIDPYNKLIDRDPEDNLVEVEKQ
ncbi:MAG: M1 family aminopeptidase [Candidatus Acidiferrum sp.]